MSPTHRLLFLLTSLLFTHTNNIRFEVQLAAVKERLEAAKAGSTRGLASPTNAVGGFSFSGSRIAKPLRGGGGADSAPSGNPTVANLQASENKRSSWFFQK